MIGANVIESARLFDVEKTVVLGSSCIYPREAAQPMKEASLLAGPLEPTNEGYAIAKTTPLELTKMYQRQYGCRLSHSWPANLYGPNTTSTHGEEHLNVETREDIAIRDLAHFIADVVNSDGDFTYDTSIPDGTPRKLVDVTRMRELTWKPSIDLWQGIADTYRWYLAHRAT